MKRRVLKSLEIFERGKEGRIKGIERIGNKAMKRKNNNEIE